MFSEILGHAMFVNPALKSAKQHVGKRSFCVILSDGTMSKKTTFVLIPSASKRARGVLKPGVWGFILGW